MQLLTQKDGYDPSALTMTENNDANRDETKRLSVDDQSTGEWYTTPKTPSQNYFSMDIVKGKDDRNKDNRMALTPTNSARITTEVLPRPWPEPAPGMNGFLYPHPHLPSRNQVMSQQLVAQVLPMRCPLTEEIYFTQTRKWT